MQPFIPQKLPLDEIDWKSLVPAISKANRSIAYFAGILHTVPNPQVLLSPLGTQEAVLSSKIEGTEATMGEVFKFEAGEAPQGESRLQDIQEIRNYRRALIRAQLFLKERPFNLNMLLELHRILLDSVRGRDKGRGSFRKIQNWIGAPRSTMEHAHFVPPPPERLMEFLDNLEKYYHSDERDPLVQLAVVHAQFEIIHPFVDGNGRLGRILVPLFLFEKKLLNRPMFYVSAWLEKHRDEYIDHLRVLGVEQGAWDRWISFFLRGLDEQACKNAETALAIKSLYERLKLQVLELTRSQFAVPLLDQMFVHPIFQATDLRFSKIEPSRPAIAALLKILRDAKIIKVLTEGSGRRSTKYVLAQLLNLCEGRELF